MSRVLYRNRSRHPIGALLQPRTSLKNHFLTIFFMNKIMLESYSVDGAPSSPFAIIDSLQFDLWMSRRSITWLFFNRTSSNDRRNSRLGPSSRSRLLFAGARRKPERFLMFFISMVIENFIFYGSSFLLDVVETACPLYEKPFHRGMEWICLSLP